MKIAASQGVIAAMVVAGCTSGYSDLAIQPAAAFDDAKYECEVMWYQSDERDAVRGKSASEQAIAKHDTIEKCIRDMEAHKAGKPVPSSETRLPSGLPDASYNGASATTADTDPRLLDQSWKDAWEKRWLCDGLTLYKAGDRGSVVLDGVGEIATHFGLAGLTPRWDWNADDDRQWDKENGYRYAVAIQRDGLFGTYLAAYFDFALADENGLTEPRMTFYGCSD